MSLDRRVLLLNQNYEPLSVCKARRALVLMMLHKAEPVERSGRFVRSVRLQMSLPSVLRLNYYVKVRRKNVPLTRRNVIRRDKRVCQYCGCRHGDMTTDHVIPRALGGEDTWENLVCACPACNARKGDRLPGAAGMKLSRPPRQPHYFTFAITALGYVPEVWRQYLFQS